MAKLKTKLENTIAETSDELEREKRLRGDVEKIRRKIEADLKVRRAYLGTINSLANLARYSARFLQEQRKCAGLSCRKRPSKMAVFLHGSTHFI